MGLYKLFVDPRGEAFVDLADFLVLFVAVWVREAQVAFESGLKKLYYMR